MAVAVFDADVLIAFLTRGDANHERPSPARPGLTRARGGAPDLLRDPLEILVGPIRAGRAEVVEQMLARLSIDDRPRSPGAGAQRGNRSARAPACACPHAYVLATALQAERQGAEEVRIETFDRSLARARARLGADGVT